VGYWPYGLSGEHEAAGWRGSNAPHFQGEETNSLRTTWLRFFGEMDSVRTIDLETRLTGGVGTLRRQIVDLWGEHWLVLDSVSDADHRTVERTWTGFPNLSLEHLSNGDALLAKVGDSLAMRIAIRGAGPSAIKTSLGSDDPFAGWVAFDGWPKPAPAIMVTQAPEETWLFSLFSLGQSNALRSSHPPTVIAFEDPENWQVALPLKSGQITVARRSDRMAIGIPNGQVTQVPLLPWSTDPTAREEVERGFSQAESEYPKFKELLGYVVRITKLALVLLMLQEIALLGVRRLRPGWIASLRLSLAVCWLLGGLWVSQVYLRS
jgi:hypothetical protein